ncbi:alpha/beta hydrolase [Metabacillus indicus]|uniref:alpha/beta hydrolase n=1 Tax=Metabacillus indicus TaxID=246786 RepID=UPI0024916CF6|nr:alpha/beta hydrolase [Metabacillus indicus]
MNCVRLELKNSRGLTLIGHLYEADSRRLVIMCHGFTSDKSSRGRFDRFAAVFQTFGWNVLAFDFSGCGESDDDTLTMAKEKDDLQSVIEYAKQRGFQSIVLYGHSLGSRICLMCYSKEVSTMILTGASTGPHTYNWNDHFTAVQMRELQETGVITEQLSSGPRNKIIIDQQMLLDFEQGNQKELLSAVACPVLIIHGNADEEERMLAETSKRGMKWLPQGSKLEVIDGASHSFMEHLNEVEKLAVEWLCQHLDG